MKKATVLPKTMDIRIYHKNHKNSTQENRTAYREERKKKFEKKACNAFVMFVLLGLKVNSSQLTQLYVEYNFHAQEETSSNILGIQITL